MNVYGEFFLKFMEPLLGGVWNIFKEIGKSLFQIFNILNYHKLLKNTLIHIKAPGVCDELSSSFIRYFQNYSIPHDFLEELTTE